ncbi:hypothetical protein F400_gp126 [Bacillus phage BCD7]|uniref:Uncharacterized protein n=1 Tax=Bacillus phage BCD7 TaxID=1136534 RepID=J9PU05_9CAUD|nr:hypothetical protein F400_gp126 [Bacillus phage BCD7]AEZ50573.1 hypothetical protein BCD7_0126 [Bacillus phage BCD7]
MMEKIRNIFNFRNINRKIKPEEGKVTIETYNRGDILMYSHGDDRGNFIGYVPVSIISLDRVEFDNGRIVYCARNLRTSNQCYPRDSELMTMEQFHEDLERMRKRAEGMR